MQQSYLFHDYETWGINPKLDFPVQFAAIRTDSDFNEVAEPVNIYCQIPNDYLPTPEACLVIGITPQLSLARGYLEYEFANKIMQEMMCPATCVIGYNSMRFDEEVTRHLFYRNFLPVYEREFLNHNGRWDIIDLARATYALSPSEIKWPYDDTGLPSFKLEALAKENELAHEQAHNALSDVSATIALTKLIKQRKPDIYCHFWQHKDKMSVRKLFTASKLQPLLYVSGTISAKQGCSTWILPCTIQPAKHNKIFAVDLSKSLQPLIELSVEELAESIFEKVSTHPRAPIITINLAKCPFIAPAKMMRPERAEQINLDRKQCLENYQTIKTMPELLIKAQNVMCLALERPITKENVNIDEMLYSRGFPSQYDKQILAKINRAKGKDLDAFYDAFQDDHFAQQLFRYQGRNFPASFNENQTKRWQSHRKERLEFGNGTVSISDYLHALELLFHDYANQPKKVAILKALHAYLEQL